MASKALERLLFDLFPHPLHLHLRYLLFKEVKSRRQIGERCLTSGGWERPAETNRLSANMNVYIYISVNVRNEPQAVTVWLQSGIQLQ